MDVRECTACGETRPLGDFAKDARTRSGVRSVCKPCDRLAVRVRRAAGPKRPGAVVLVPSFPVPPEEAVRSADPGESDALSGGAGSYTAAAERFIGALDPPAGDADALLVHSLRGLADLADRFSFGLDVVKDVNSLVASMVRVQRELAATRAARAKDAPSAQPRSKLGRFGATG